MLSPFLKKIRVVIALIFFTLTLLLFIDFTNTFSIALIDTVLYLQFVPSLVKFINLLSFSIIGFLIIIILTLLFGRVYCSTICPLGILQDIFLFFKRKFKKKNRYTYRKASNWTRYSIMFVTILFLIAGSTIMLIFLDPYSIFGKITSSLIRPIIIFINNLIVQLLSNFNNYSLYPFEIKSPDPGSLLFSILFLVLIAWMTIRFSRLYCNLLCPVGSFLGFLSRYSLFKISLDQTTCTQCGICANVCKAECIDILNKKVDFSRCVGCFNCLDSCPHNGVHFTFKRPLNTLQKQEAPNLSKRNFLINSSILLISGLGISGITNAQRRNRRRFVQTPIRKEHPVTPPGSISIDHYNDNCTACYLCVSICPTQVIQPSFLTFGLKGILQPKMDYSANYCNYDCLKCGEVCPTGAILPLTLEEKQLTQLGKAIFVKKNCIVYTDNTDCGSCSEYCPTKAVDMKPFRRNLFIPYVIPEICIGCGACEYACPTEPKAIYVEGNPVHALAKKPETKKIKEETSDEFPF
jgi:ferredoxin